MQDNTKTISPFKNGKYHGYWNLYHDSSKSIWFKCFFVKSLEYGYEEIYDSNGIIRDKTYYAR